MLAEHASAGQPLAGRVLPLQDHGSGCSGGGSSSTSKVDHIVIMTSTEDVSERGKTGKGVTSASCSNGGGNGGGGVGCGPSLGDCPWARLAGVDGCLSETYCLWFQLLARAYWGELELGLRGSSGCKASWSRLREASRRNCVRSRAKQKGGVEASEASGCVSPTGGDEEPFSWPGPKTLRLRRTSQGFGFTLRHFIVYPPESAVQSSLKEEDNGSRGRPRNRLEPMDTIFVKQVKEGGPAHGAGLCTGDRIVKVNGESIIGKTYSQVIALIQNSDTSLELCVMPKDEDILQLAYSQDAYLKGNEAYSGNAQNIPEPPPICYPRIECKAPPASSGSTMAQTAEHPSAPSSVGGVCGSGGGGAPRSRTTSPATGPAHASSAPLAAPEMGYRREITVPPSPPPSSSTQLPKNQTVVCVCNESVRTVVVSLTDTVAPSGSRVGEAGGVGGSRSGPSHRTEENRHQATPPSPGPSGSITQPPYAPSRPVDTSRLAAAPPATVRTGSQLHPDSNTPSPSPLSTSPNHYSPSSPGPAPNTPSPCSPHQNIDWRTYTTYKEYMDNKRLYMYGCRTIQERLDSLRAAAAAVAASRGNGGSQQQAPAPAASAGRSPGLLGSQVRRRSTSHDRAYASPSGGGIVPLRSLSQERLLGPLGERGLYRNWARSASQDALPSSTPPGGATAKPRARSCDYLGRQGGGEGLAARLVEVEEQQILALRGDEARAIRLSSSTRGGSQPLRNTSTTGGGAGDGGAAGATGTGFTDLALSPRAESLGSSLAGPTSLMGGPRHMRLPVKAASLDASASSAASYVASALASIQSHFLSASQDSKDQRHAAITGVGASGSSTVAVGNHLPHTPITSPLQPAQQPRGRAESLKEPGSREAGRAARSASCSASSKSPALRILQRGAGAGASADSPRSNGTAAQLRPQLRRTEAQDQEGLEGADAKVVVVMRRDKSHGGGAQAQPIRHPSYILAVNDADGGPGSGAGSPGSGVEGGGVCWLPNDARREVQMRRLGEQQHQASVSDMGGSLDSIPFIDEPSSPSMEQDGSHILASAVISVAPVTPLITTIPPSPTSPSPPIRRQLSHDQDSLRLTILSSDSATKTERSKSCDEGLDNYREESRGRGLKNLVGLRGLKKAVDRSSEDSGSFRRDSSSDVFSDATKEGPLYFRQLNADKGKRMGGGMRPWKQMHAVLRGHTLCLYKDKREGHANATHQTEEDPLPISIKACLIDISYSETKRKNVLRLTTSDCEYLFQAEDREDMLSWIRVIQQNSNLDEENATITSTDLINRKIKEYNSLMSPPTSKTEPSPKSSRIRQTLLGSKGDAKATSPHSPKHEHKVGDEMSPPKDKVTWRKGMSGLMRKPFEKKPAAGVTFGVRLDDCPPAQTNRFVPLIVEVCCKLVEERGLEYTGIYRVPGNNAAISNMQEELNNKGMADIDIQDDKWRDLNVISSLLKSFFRKLPEPLFTNDRYADFIDANRIEDPTERLKVLKRLLHELPDHHYETLKFLSGHLKAVADNSEKNKMEPRNLAIVFGPTLVRTSDDNMTHMVTHMPDQYKIVETLIQQYDWFFTEEGPEEPVTSVQQENAVESQPVPNINHLLTNIGRTGPSPGGDVSDSPTSDSAKSKQNSWAYGKDQCSRELLVSSIFAAASRKRKKHKEKPQPSSSDDDLDAVFTLQDLDAAIAEDQDPEDGDPASCSSSPQTARGLATGVPQKRENGKAMEAIATNTTSSAAASTNVTITTPKSRKEHRNSFFLREKRSVERTIVTSPSPCPSPSPSPSPILRTPALTARLPKSSLSDGGPSSSQPDEPTSDLGTMSSGASVPRGRPRRWLSSAGLEPGSGFCGGGSSGGSLPLGASAGAEVSSITSDYSTTSSNTFLTGGEGGSLLSPEVGSVSGSRGGEEADDERSELISEGRPTETDSDSDFPVFPPSAGPSPAATSINTTHSIPEICVQGIRSSASASLMATPTGRPSLPSHKLIECDTLARRRSLRQKTDSDSSVDALGAGPGGTAGGVTGATATAAAGGGASKASSALASSGKRLSRMFEVIKKGRSTGSLSSSSRSESERNTTATATPTTAATVTTTTTPSSTTSSSSSSAHPATSSGAGESSWIRFTERLRLRLGRGASHDDSSSTPQRRPQRSRSPDPPRRSNSGARRSKGLRRRHTMGGQRDFAQLQAMHDWSEQGGVDQGAELTQDDRLRPGPPKCSSQQDFNINVNIHEWIASRERAVGGAGCGPDPAQIQTLAQTSTTEQNLTPPVAQPEEDDDIVEGGGGGGGGRDGSDGRGGGGGTTTATTHSGAAEQVNGGGPQAKNNKAGHCAGVDAHPQKLSGAQVVRSRFYQYL
ncbi:rho GTPase-activating protein 21-like isoform X3 [Engraulis encrasicolus]|uniref:rho GTPase-activating protein 21-like isoform X3 n=1 Tax=Engraulis encrasicolus TaxID=184585 RepID=UPI002FD64048